jgi:hypothetical protein
MKIIFKEMTIFFIFAVLSTFPGALMAEESSDPLGEPTLTRAVMCESIQKFAPNNIAVVFSIDVGRIHCFTEFDPVPKQTIIFHKWYQSGNLVSVKQLTVNPPRWSSISSMQLRDADKGPWQVEVTDKNGKLLHTLRFSITD